MEAAGGGLGESADFMIDQYVRLCVEKASGLTGFDSLVWINDEPYCDWADVIKHMEANDEQWQGHLRGYFMEKLKENEFELTESSQEPSSQESQEPSSQEMQEEFRHRLPEFSEQTTMATAGEGGEDVPESWEEVADQSPGREGRKRPLNRETSSSSSTSPRSQTSLEDIKDELVDDWDDITADQRRVSRNKERETQMEKEQEGRDAKRQRLPKNPPTQARLQPGSRNERQNMVNQAAANTMWKKIGGQGKAQKSAHAGIKLEMSNEKVQAAKARGMEFGKDPLR